MRAAGFLFWKSYGPAARNAGSFPRKELGGALRIGLPSCRLVFIDIFATCYFYRDPSLSLRVTGGGGKART